MLKLFVKLFVVNYLIPPAPLLHLDNTTSTYLRARHPTGNVAVKSFNVHTSTSDPCELITEHRHHRSVRTDTLSHKSLCLRATPHNIISHRRSGNRRYGPGLSESPRHLHNHRHMRIVIPAYHSATGAVCSFTLGDTILSQQHSCPTTPATTPSLLSHSDTTIRNGIGPLRI